MEELRSSDEYWMEEALKEARLAYSKGEVPIGAIIVREGQVIGRGHNLRETDKQAVAHAEILAIQAANEELAAWRLEGATLYVTVEPCPMCCGGIINSRIDRVVYGASDPKAGCAGSLMNLLEDTRFNHQTTVERGVLEAQCREIMQEFFQALRARNKARRANKSE